MSKNNNILEYRNPVAKGMKPVKKLFFFHQGDYFGMYAYIENQELYAADIYITAYLGFYDDFMEFIQKVKTEIGQVGEVYLILDFKKTSLLPMYYFDPQNQEKYYDIMNPKDSTVHIQSVTAEHRGVSIVYNVNEQIVPLSKVAMAYSQVKLLPSSRGMIEQQQMFDKYLSISLRKHGFYHTLISDDQLIDHGFKQVYYEADFLNYILEYTRSLQGTKDSLVISLDGYADMASVLEDRLLNMGFRISRIHTRELGNLPEEFSFLPMYSFYNSYQNIRCVL